MSIINKASEKFLEQYINNASPTGFESEGQKLWIDYIKPYIHEWHLDSYGTVYGVINPNKKYKVVIEGHADEISWYVNYITDNGFLHVIRNGGSDHMIAPSMRVKVFTAKGIINGVFGWPAIHTRTNKNNTLKAELNNIFIDVGAKDKAEVEEMGIHPGCVALFEDGFTVLNDRYYTGRALDNRMGGFCIAEVARLLHENKIDLPYSLYIVNAVQEEVGLRGAEMIANTIKPNVAIITDVCHDTGTPLVEAKTEGDTKCGKGPVLTIAPAVHNKLLNQIRDVAQKKEIQYQLAASSRTTGTDTDAFAYSNGGTPSALISLPLRYMHTTVEMAHKEDVENVVKLIYECLLTLSPDDNYKYF
jgi:putative aminopeptidase FrvX